MEGTPPDEVVVVIAGRLTRADIARLCEQVRALPRASHAEIVCDVARLDDPDAVAVDALARVGLTARRCGSTLRLRDAPEALLELIALMGLEDVLPEARSLALEPRGKVEQREEPGGVEEEGDPADDPV